MTSQQPHHCGRALRGGERGKLARVAQGRKQEVTAATAKKADFRSTQRGPEGGL